MSEEPGGNDDGSDGVAGWEPIEDGASLDERERQIEEREKRLEQKEETLNEREEEIEQREREILDRRDKIADEREELSDKEEQLEGRAQQLDDRKTALDKREKELSRRAEEIDTKEEALEEYGGGSQTFTRRPRVVGSILLGLLGLAALGAAIGTYAVATGQGFAALSQTQALIAAGVLVVAALIEFLGGFWAYRGKHWFVSILAGMVGMVLLFPVGLTATILITVGESQFS